MLRVYSPIKTRIERLDKIVAFNLDHVYAKTIAFLSHQARSLEPEHVATFENSTQWAHLQLVRLLILVSS